MLGEKSSWLGAGEAADRVDLDVIKIGDDGWRVSLRDADRSNPFGLLGFVAYDDGCFRVCAVGRPGADVEAATLAEAIEALRPCPADAEMLLRGLRP